MAEISSLCVFVPEHLDLGIKGNLQDTGLIGCDSAWLLVFACSASQLFLWSKCCLFIHSVQSAIMWFSINKFAIGGKRLAFSTDLPQLMAVLLLTISTKVTVWPHSVADQLQTHFLIFTLMHRRCLELATSKQSFQRQRDRKFIVRHCNNKQLE